MVRELCRQGHEAAILVPNENFQPSDFPDLENGQLSFFDAKSYPTWQGKYKALQRFLEERAPCVFIPTNNEIYSAVCPKLSDSILCLGWIQSDEDYHYRHIDRLGDSWNACVCVSEFISEEARKRFPRLEKKIQTIPNAIEIPPTPQRETADELRIIYTGRLDQAQKRVMDLGKVAAHLSERNVRCSFSLVGSGSHEQELRSVFSGMGEKIRVNFMGRIPHQEVLCALASHDILLMTSEFEGTSLSLLEAMAQCCVPVVTNIRSGVPELIQPGSNGFLFEVGDTTECANILSDLEANREKLPRIGSKARETVEAGLFNIRNQAKAFQELVSQIQTSEDFVGQRDGRYRPPEFVNLSRCHNFKRWAKSRLLKLRPTSSLYR